MSNITKAKNNLKQKLSLNDYLIPSRKHTSKPANQHPGKPVKLHTIKQAQKKTDTAKLKTKHLYTHNAKTKAMPQASMPAKQLADNNEKIKATYYLSKDDNQALLDIFIKRLQEQKKVDKSALIAEAIRLLYKREIKK